MCRNNFFSLKNINWLRGLKKIYFHGKFYSSTDDKNIIFQKFKNKLDAL